MKSFLIGIKNVLLWSYERGSWQYDVLCLLIVAAVFLVPSSYFGDRDRTRPQTKGNGSPVPVSDNGRVEQEVIEAEKLRLFLQARNILAESMDFPQEAIVLYLHDRCRCEIALVRQYEVVVDSQGRTGYRVWFRVN